MCERLLSELEAAQRIGWSAANLRARRARAARQPGSDAAPVHVRVGGSVRYAPAKVTAWLLRHPEYQRRTELRASTMTQAEVCDLLGVGRSTLRERRARLRDDPDSDAAPVHIQVGQEIRYDRLQVQAWIDRQTTTPGG